MLWASVVIDKNKQQKLSKLAKVAFSHVDSLFWDQKPCICMSELISNSPCETRRMQHSPLKRSLQLFFTAGLTATVLRRTFNDRNIMGKLCFDLFPCHSSPIGEVSLHRKGKYRLKVTCVVFFGKIKYKQTYEAPAAGFH